MNFPFTNNTIIQNKKIKIIVFFAICCLNFDLIMLLQKSSVSLEAAEVIYMMGHCVLGVEALVLFARRTIPS